MFSSNSATNYSSTAKNINPCNSILSYSNGNNNCTTNNLNHYGPANCYRPLQQLYKTVYSPAYGNNASSMNIACICRPAERYKTTNMTYGSFYYDNSMSTEKNLSRHYDKAAFARCYDDTRTRMGYPTSGNNRGRDTSIFSNGSDSPEYQYWIQPTSDACCPIDCCNNSSYTTANCVNSQHSTPYYSSSSQNPCPSYSLPTSSTTNKSSNIQVRCV